MFAEEFFAEGMADEVESIRANICKYFVGELGRVNVNNEASDDVVC